MAQGEHPLESKVQVEGFGFGPVALPDSTAFGILLHPAVGGAFPASFLSPSKCSANGSNW